MAKIRLVLGPIDIRIGCSMDHQVRLGTSYLFLTRRLGQIEGRDVHQDQFVRGKSALEIEAELTVRPGNQDPHSLLGVKWYGGREI